MKTGFRKQRWKAYSRLFYALVDLCLSAFICGSLSSCAKKAEVTLYTSVDQPIAAKVIAAFEKRTGIHVVLKTDTEATKSVGLAERLRTERDHPVADVFWSNEVFHTVNLADEGLFKPMLNVPAFLEIRPEFRDDNGLWAGVGLRARTLAVAPSATNVTSINDLLDARFKDKIAIARPLAGTTGGHVAALYALWGPEKADDFFRRLHANGVLVLGGNGPVAESVGSGNVLVGLTDNDDVVNATQAGGTLRAVLPDQSPEAIGTLAVPTTVAIVDRPDHEDAANKLASFLLSAETEKLLIAEKFCAFSVRAAPDAIHVMNVKFADAAKSMADADKRATDLLDGRVK